MFPVLALRSGSVVLIACPLVAIVEDQVKDSVRRDLVAVYTKRSVIEGCYQLIFIGPEVRMHT